MAVDLEGAASTTRRKLSRSLEQRGLGGTLARAAALPFRRLAGALDPAARGRRRDTLEFDRRHGVDTAADADPGWMAGIASPSWKHGADYDPVPEADFRIAMEAIPGDRAGWTFVDYGAGKGKALCLATEWPFARIVGVEYQSRLAAAARENARRWRAGTRAAEIEVVEADALEFAVPAGPLVLFFHHPFEAPVFDRVLERIARSLATDPRAVWIVYHDPRCGERVERAGFRLHARLDGSTSVYAAGEAS